MPTLKDKISDIVGNCKMEDYLHHIQINKKQIDQIMDEIDEEQKILRPALRWFAQEMEEDLRKNDFKGGWLDGELNYYRDKALENLKKLEDIESMKFETNKDKGYAIERCVKAANYTMMIAHNFIEELRKETDETKA